MFVLRFCQLSPFRKILKNNSATNFSFDNLFRCNNYIEGKKENSLKEAPLICYQRIRDRITGSVLVILELWKGIEFIQAIPES